MENRGSWHGPRSATVAARGGQPGHQRPNPSTAGKPLKRITLASGLTKPRGPGPARVQRIPPRNFPLMPARTRIVVTESIDADVPNRPIMVDYKSLGQRDPDRLHDEKAACEIVNVHVRCGVDGARVLT